MTGGSFRPLARRPGKTTLLRLLAGAIEPHEGSVAVRPRGAIVASCPQGVRDLTDDVRALATAEDALAPALRGRLALEPAALAREATTHAISARARMKNKNDHDAKSMGRKVTSGWADQRAGRTVAVVHAELERARSSLPTIERDRTTGGKVFAICEPAPWPVLFHVDAPEVRRGDRVILRDVRVAIARADRLRITGANGAGKTTLLEQSSPHGPARGSCTFRRRSIPPPVAALVAGLRAATEAERGRILAVFSALGSDPERVLVGRSETLSSGEARKLTLADGLGRQVWALVLDEPTKHLDLPTIERLERALEDYRGAVVLVTHDAAFAAAVTRRSLHVEDGLVS